MSDATILPAAPKPELEPIGLTVHSLPAPEAAALAAQRTRRGRWQMLLVLLACAAPVIASYFTYYVIRPEGRRNFGELVQPQRPMPDLPATALDGRATTLGSLTGQWLLVSVSGANCQADCEQRLYLQRQLRESLGREKDRLERVWLLTDAAPVAPALLPALQQAQVLRVDGTALGQWLAPAAGQQLQEHLYLVDPQGHWMLRFPANLDAAGATKAKKDLERLLRAAASWDKAGR